MPTPLTPNQIQERSDRYADLSRLKLEQAQQELDRGDTAQASEKAYGAFINQVKACGELRGWNRYNHHRAELILEQLAAENQAPELLFTHMAAKAQHSNYFEYEQSRFYVQTGIDGVAATIEKLEAIRHQPAPPPKHRDYLTPDQRRRLALLNQPPQQEPKPAEQPRSVPKT